jgi:copper chaperone CopZ
MKYVIIVAGLLIAAGSNAVTRKAPTTASSCEAPLTPPDHAASASDAATTVTVHFAIQGMVTGACPTLIEAAVSRIPGVVRVEADLKAKTATVEYRQGSTTPEHIQSVIKDRTGFDAELAK